MVIHAGGPQEELAFAFDCQGDELIGILHKGDESCRLGVLTIVAGGPQYRAGVGRGLVHIGRSLASRGIPVMRFDHRGVGDSEGDVKRFSAMVEDIEAAIAQFMTRAPHIRGVILWGGCEAATSALINAPRLPAVMGVVAGNPFVSTPTAAAKVARKHYLSRLVQLAFWKKLLTGGYSAGEYATAALRRLGSKGPRANSGASGAKADDGNNGNHDFLDDLLQALQNFNGQILFLRGDRFLRSDEFDLLVNSSAEWRSAYRKSGYQQVDIKDGDQVFSTIASRERMIDVASDWIFSAFPVWDPSRDTVS